MVGMDKVAEALPEPGIYIEIAVFHEGAVIQQGTHEELVAEENGKYFELWHAQAQYYVEKGA